MALIRWEPVRELNTIQNEMNRLFNTFFDAPAPAPAGGRRVGPCPARAGSRRWTWSRPATISSCGPICPGLSEEDVQHRARGQRPHRLGRAQGRARGAQGGLLPRRAGLGLVQPLADPPRGVDPDAVQRRLRSRRARGTDPKPEAAQAAQGRDRRRRDERGARHPGDDRGQRGELTAPSRRSPATPPSSTRLTRGAVRAGPPRAGASRRRRYSRRGVVHRPRPLRGQPRSHRHAAPRRTATSGRRRSCRWPPRGRCDCSSPGISRRSATS